MKVICGWCMKHIRDKEPLSDDRVSHGMCEECFNREMNKPLTQAEQKMADALEPRIERVVKLLIG